MRYLKAIWKLLQYVQMCVFTWALIVVICLFMFGEYTASFGTEFVISISINSENYETVIVPENKDSNSYDTNVIPDVEIIHLNSQMEDV